MHTLWKRIGDCWAYKNYILERAINAMGREEFRLSEGDEFLNVYNSLPSAKRAAAQHDAQDASPRDLAIKLQRGSANDNQLAKARGALGPAIANAFP
jgi:hypothetical protein